MEFREKRVKVSSDIYTKLYRMKDPIIPFTCMFGCDICYY